MKNAASITWRAGVACLLLGSVLWLTAPPGAAQSRKKATNPGIRLSDITITSADQQSAFGFFTITNDSGDPAQAVQVEDVRMAWQWIGEGGARDTCSAVRFAATANGATFGPGFTIPGNATGNVDYQIVCDEPAPFVARQIKNFVSIKLVGRPKWFSSSGSFKPGTTGPPPDEEPPPPPPPTITRVEESGATYTGSWTAFTDSGTGVASSDGIVGASNAALSTVTLTFTGTGVSWIGFACESCGIANVYLNDTLIATVDTFAPSRPATTGVLYSTSGLASGTYALRIEVTGTKNASSGDFFVVVDAFDVTN